MKARSPVLGYNHNVRYAGRLWHVQTEDSGVNSPHVFTHLFHDGTILATKRFDYDPSSEIGVVQKLMQSQHKAMLRELKAGVFDEKIGKFFGQPVVREVVEESTDPGSKSPVVELEAPPEGEAEGLRLVGPPTDPSLQAPIDIDVAQLASDAENAVSAGTVTATLDGSGAVGRVVAGAVDRSVAAAAPAGAGPALHRSVATAATAGGAGAVALVDPAAAARRAAASARAVAVTLVDSAVVDAVALVDSTAAAGERLARARRAGGTAPDDSAAAGSAVGDAVARVDSATAASALFAVDAAPTVGSRGCRACRRAASAAAAARRLRPPVSRRARPPKAWWWRAPR